MNKIKIKQRKPTNNTKKKRKKIDIDYTTQKTTKIMKHFNNEVIANSHGTK